MRLLLAGVAILATVYAAITAVAGMTADAGIAFVVVGLALGGVGLIDHCDKHLRPRRGGVRRGRI